MSIIDEPESRAKPKKKSDPWRPAVRWRHHLDTDPVTELVAPEDLIADGPCQFALACHLEYAIAAYKSAHGRYPRPRDMEICIRIDGEIYA